MNATSDADSPFLFNESRTCECVGLKWRLVSEPGAAIEVHAVTIPPHVQAAISAALELGKQERKKKSTWRYLLTKFGLKREHA